MLNEYEDDKLISFEIIAARKVREISKLTESLETIINDTNDLAKKRLYRKKLQNKEIIKTVAEYIADGFSTHEAIMFTAEDFDDTIFRVEVLWQAHRNSKKPIIEYSLKFAAIKLRDAGMLCTEICHILGISAPYLRKILNKNIIL